MKVISDKKILTLIDQNKWDDILEMIKNRSIDPNKSIISGNNIFHIACMRNQTDFIKKYINIAQSGDLGINLNKLNSEGIPGIHLYYKFGGSDDSFLQNKLTCYQDIEHNSLIEYVKNNIDLLEKLIANSLQFGCIGNLFYNNTQEANFCAWLINVIIPSTNQSDESSQPHDSPQPYDSSQSDGSPQSDNLSESDNLIESNRYLEIFTQILPHIDPRNVIYYTIYKNRSDILILLIKNGYRMNIKNKNDTTPLMFAVYYKRYQHITIILNSLKQTETVEGMYNVIANGGTRNNERPVDISIRNAFVIPTNCMDIDMDIEIKIDTNGLELLFEWLEWYCEWYKAKYGKEHIFEETDQYHSTYLHNLLKMINRMNEFFCKESDKDYFFQHIPTKINKILRFLIKHTNLNKESYMGTTPIHQLFLKGLWKNHLDLLGKRKINMMAIDENGKNVYQYIKPEDMDLFIKFSERANLIVGSNTIKTDFSSKIGFIKNVKIVQNYGMFNSNLIHNMIYMEYLMKKYPTLYIPHVQYNEKKHANHLAKISMFSYDLSTSHKQLNRIVRNMGQLFYCYVSHYIIWVSQTHHYIDPNLEDLLKKNRENDNNGRYILLKITLIISEDVIHSNMVLFDKVKLIGRRFEPVGISDLVDGNELDNMLEQLFTNVWGKIEYLRPEDYLKGFSFQLTSGDDVDKNLNLGDPYGYCLAWTIWFIEIRLSDPDTSDRELIEKALNRNMTNILLSDMLPEDDLIGSKNYYLDFIRRYAIMLDERKNEFLEKIGIKPYEYYQIYQSDKTIDMITKYFQK